MDTLVVAESPETIVLKSLLGTGIWYCSYSMARENAILLTWDVARKNEEVWGLGETFPLKMVLFLRIVGYYKSNGFLWVGWYLNPETPNPKIHPWYCSVSHSFPFHFTPPLLYSGGSRGGKSGHGPPSKLSMEFALPLGGRKRNDRIGNLSKSKDFAPPYQRRLRIWPPYGKIPH